MRRTGDSCTVRIRLVDAPGVGQGTSTSLATVAPRVHYTPTCSMTSGDFGTFVGSRETFHPSPDDRRHYLTMVKGPEIGRRVELGREPLVIGRGSTSTLVIADPELSKRHCAVVERLGVVEVTDLGSTNGTFIDGARVGAPMQLSVDSILQVGGLVFRHELRDSAEVRRQVEQAAELRRARAYVEALLPPRRMGASFTLDYVHEPCATLGGDALGCVDLPDGRVGFYLIDVCGHGAGAAMHSVAVMQHIRASPLAHEMRAQPSQILRALNSFFDMDAHDGMFFSIWYGVWDPASRELRYASAGHPPPLRLDAGGGPAIPLERADPPIGVVPGGEFREHSLHLQPGASLVLFSDGAYEIRDREGRDGSYEEFVRRLEAIGRQRPLAAQPLRDLVMDWSSTPRLADDLSIIVVTFS